MQARIELDVAIPQTFADRPIEARLIRDYLVRAEGLGFQGAWVVEQILGSIPSLEAVGLLTYAAAVTERLRLGSAVLLTALRSPIHLAKTIATLDHLSAGRVVVGVGLGGNPAVYPAYGLSAARRAARFGETVRLMKALWTEPRVNFDGDFFKLRNASMEPKPRQAPHPPIWFGAHHPNALRRAVELGDGFIGAGSASTATFAEEVRILERLLREGGRDRGRFAVGKRVYIAIDDDRARAGRRLEDWFKAFYGRPELAADVAVWGDASACLDGLAGIVAAGARFLLLNPVFDELEHLERFATIASKL
jgi:probable F420-dependent oxidoreductase